MLSESLDTKRKTQYGFLALSLSSLKCLPSEVCVFIILVNA